MELPFQLREKSRILVTGAGGGFDIYCALPVALKLKESGHEVSLANYSFTNLGVVQNATTGLKNLSCVTSKSILESGGYFPELHLSKWWQKTFSEEKSVWCYGRIGVRPLAEIFQYLKATLDLNAIVVLDGGVDGLFIGNEYDMATPSMDAISIIAASTVQDWTKIYAFTAFGTEGAESNVRHSDALLRISELTARDSMMGVSALTRRSNTGSLFIDAVEFVNRQLPSEKQSVIANSVVEALKGDSDLPALTQKRKSRRCGYPRSQLCTGSLTLMQWQWQNRI